MKKFFAVCSLLMMVSVGAKAVVLGDDDRIGVSISSFNYNDWTAPEAGAQPGAEVTMIIDKNYKTVLTLPKKSAKFYLDSVVVESRVQKCLDVTGVNQHMRSVGSLLNDYRSLYDQIPNLYDFEGTKTFTLQVGDLSKIYFTVTKEMAADSSYVITIVPNDVDLVRSSWDEIKYYVENTQMETKDYAAFAAEGSYIQNNTERIYCNSGLLIGDRYIRPNLQNIQDATLYYDCKATKKVSGILAPGSYLNISHRHYTLIPGYFCHFSVYNSAKNTYIPGFLSDFREDVSILLEEENDSQLKKNAVDYAFRYLKRLDENVIGMMPFNVKIWFSDEATGINEVNAEAQQAQSIYTIDGRKVNSAKEHGIYIINGQKVVK